MSLPQDTCPLCRQQALDRRGNDWICDFCGCELEFDAATRHTRVRYFPPQYTALSEAIGADWLTRRQMFDRAETAQPVLVRNAENADERSGRFGPLIIIALALLLACVVLGAVASALVISPSIARTRRSIAEAYRPSSTPTMTLMPDTTSILSTSTQVAVSITVTASVTNTAPITPAATLVATATAPQIVPPTPTAPASPPPNVIPLASPTRPALPPTFTPIVTPIITATLVPTVQVSATATLTPATASPTINPLASPLTPTATATLVTQGGGAQPTPTASPTPVLGAVVFQGTVQISYIKYQGTEANEADEYVEIKNVGTVQVSMDGWSLKAVRASDNQILDQFIFGNGFVLPVGAICHIYTAKLSTADNCGTGTGFDSPQGIWPNTPGARASLFNQANVEQARFSY